MREWEEERERERGGGGRVCVCTTERTRQKVRDSKKEYVTFGMSPYTHTHTCKDACELVLENKTCVYIYI